VLYRQPPAADDGFTPEDGWVHRNPLKQGFFIQWTLFHTYHHRGLYQTLQIALPLFILTLG
jgi:hypothetical protein